MPYFCIVTLEDIQSICRKMPGVTEDIKWGHDLVFSVGGKMFCAAAMSEVPVSASFKVEDESFDEISSRPGFRPAPYLAKHKWVFIDDISGMNKREWEKHLKKSYELVKSKLPAKIRKQLENPT